MIVLGVHGGVTVGQHEPAAALAVNGRIVALCEEERHNRVKSCYGYLPYRAIRACLAQAGVKWEDINLVVSPGKTYDDFGARWKDYLRHSFGSCPQLELVHHQEAHIASSFYASGLDSALVLSLDATGDGACSMQGHATKEGGIKVFRTLPTIESLGYFYTLMTYFLGFEDGDEYKVMGLAPYGQPNIDLSEIIKPVKGGWEFDWSCVRSDPAPKSPFEPLYSPKVATLLGKPNRRPHEPLTQWHKDLARSTQAAMEECLISLITSMREKFPKERNFCYAGGVAMNCSANKRLLFSGWFDNVYVPPVSSDRGLALGAAYLGAVKLGDKPWPLLDPYLGASYSNDSIEKELDANGCRYEEVADPSKAAAELIAKNCIVGWHQGRSEAGARALGNRSIVASCASTEMRDKVNARIKYREEFRPFAPSVLQEDAPRYFKMGPASDLPYMAFTLEALPEQARSIAAVVHVDGTARVQTVRSSNNELYYNLIREYRGLTGASAILNTSYNLKGQPIVESPRDALMTFYGCGLDALVVGNFVVRK